MIMQHYRSVVTGDETVQQQHQTSLNQNSNHVNNTLI
jgi:hypothetical protein